MPNWNWFLLNVFKNLRQWHNKYVNSIRKNAYTKAIIKFCVATFIVFALRVAYLKRLRKIKHLPDGLYGIPLFGSVLTMKIHGSVFYTQMGKRGEITMCMLGPSKKLYTINNVCLLNKLICKMEDKPQIMENFWKNYVTPEPPFSMLSQFTVHGYAQKQQQMLNKIQNLHENDYIGSKMNVNEASNQWYHRRKSFSQSIHLMVSRDTLDDKLCQILSCYTFNNINNNINNHGSKSIIWYPRECIKHATFNTVYLCTFDKILAIDSKEYKNFVNDMNLLFSSQRRAVYAQVLPKCISNILFPGAMENMGKALRNIMKFVKKDVQQVLSKMDDNLNDTNTNEQYLCLLEILYLKYLEYYKLDLKYDKTCQQQTTSDIFQILLAGIGPTSTVVEVGVLLAAKYQDIQYQVYEELKNIFGSNDRQFSLRKIYKCPKLRAFVSEALRISCATFGDIRTCIKDVRCVKYVNIENESIPTTPQAEYIAEHSDCKEIWDIFEKDKKEKKLKVLYDYVIQKDSWILTNLQYMLKENENIWNLDKNPIKMNLNYWLTNVDYRDNNIKCRYVANRNSIPFGVGNRDCVAQGIAIKQIEAFMGNLLLNYQVYPPNGQDCKMSSIEFKAHGALNFVKNEMGVMLIKR